MRRHLAAAALVAVGALVAACSSDSKTVAPATTGAATTSAAATSTLAPDTTPPQTTVAVSTTTTVAELPTRPGAVTEHLRVGPFDIQPGQNNIDTKARIPQPSVDGWVVGIRPNLRFADGTVPAVDVVHLHHGVWLSFGKPDATAPLPERFFAAGEEKTTMALPAPYGYRYHTTDKWVLNYMLHNLTPQHQQVWVTYDIDIIPDTASQAAAMVNARPVWMDVQNGSVYPVFDVLRGGGDGTTYTFPDQAKHPYAGKPAPLNKWTVDRDGVLIATAGHLHPGGLHTDLFDTRSGKTAHLFRSDAKYYEPAGAVSWDVAMTATTPTWHVAVKKGDVLSTSATYDSKRASWYESMGIMVVWMGDPGGTADDPFTTKVDTAGMLTHGHLAENDHHGGAPDTTYLDLTALPSKPASATIPIKDWLYTQGDMNFSKSVPTVKPGGTITYDNLDANIGAGQWHTITACAAPCNQSTGIAYPLADGPVIFDSGELGLGGPPTANRTTWTIPNNLPVGTYTYFCRIHPLMRGAFRVEK
jgi:plastocyanin